jgi:hypothetical protein
MANVTLSKNEGARLFFLFGFLFTGWLQPLSAQPFTTDNKIAPVELKLAPYVTGDRSVRGRLGKASITQTKETMYFFVRGLSIYSPEYFGITTNNPSSAIHVSLHKANWIDIERSGDTDKQGHWETEFKTEGDFGVKVVSKKVPVNYTILVWVGDEIDVQLPSPFTVPSSGGGVAANRSHDTSADGGLSSDPPKRYGAYAAYGVIASLAILAIFLSIVLKARWTRHDKDNR